MTVGKSGFWGEAACPSGAISGEVYDQIKKGIPMGRWGGPEDIGHAVLFLVSEYGSYITGQCMIIDGSLTVAP